MRAERRFPVDLTVAYYRERAERLAMLHPGRALATFARLLHVLLRLIDFNLISLIFEGLSNVLLHTGVVALMEMWLNPQ